MEHEGRGRVSTRSDGVPLNLLFVTWDGPGTTYHETLFMPLLMRATRPEDQVHVLQFTWEAAQRCRRVAALSQRMGMHYEVRMWRRQPRPLAVPSIIARGGVSIARKVRRDSIDIVLARSVIPGAMGTVSHFGSSGHSKLIYDADGLVADERAEFGDWRPEGLRYRIFNWLERTAVRRAERVLVRTPEAVRVLRVRAGVSTDRFHVVTNGKDVDLYSPGTVPGRESTRGSLGVPSGAPLVVYAGSIGPQYLPQEMLRLFSVVAKRHEGAHFLVLTQGANQALMRDLCDRRVQNRLILREARPDDVPGYLAAADLGLALRSSTLSQSAVAPIKVAEYLLCGVPVAYSAGIGSVDSQLDPAVGFQIRGNEPEYDRLADWLVNNVLPRRQDFREQCRQRGLAHFSLEKGAAEYREAFEAAIASGQRVQP